MIWIVITMAVLVGLTLWAALRVGALEDEANLWAMHIPHGWDPEEDTHVRVVPGPYDHEARGDFDA